MRAAMDEWESDCGEETVFERVRIAYARERARWTGGSVFRDGTVELFSCPFPDRLNGLLSPPWPEQQVPELWLRAVALFRKTGQGMFVSFGPSSDRQPLRELIQQLGGRPAGRYPLMELDLAALKEVPPLPGLRVERIGDFSFYDRHPHPWLGLPGAPFREEKLRFLRKCGEGASPRLWQFTALYERRLAGTVTVFAHGDEVVLFDVFVDRMYRRRGIGTRLVAEACRFARETGMRAAGLAASGDAAAGLYRKTGFEPTGFCDDFYLPVALVGKLAETA